MFKFFFGLPFLKTNFISIYQFWDTYYIFDGHFWGTLFSFRLFSPFKVSFKFSIHFLYMPLVLCFLIIILWSWESKIYLNWSRKFLEDWLYASIPRSERKLLIEFSSMQSSNYDCSLYGFSKYECPSDGGGTGLRRAFLPPSPFYQRLWRHNCFSILLWYI